MKIQIEMSQIPEENNKKISFLSLFLKATNPVGLIQKIDYLEKDLNRWGWKKIIINNDLQFPLYKIHLGELTTCSDVLTGEWWINEKMIVDAHHQFILRGDHLSSIQNISAIGDFLKKVSLPVASAAEDKKTKKLKPKKEKPLKYKPDHYDLSKLVQEDFVKVLSSDELIWNKYHYFVKFEMKKPQALQIIGRLIKMFGTEIAEELVEFANKMDVDAFKEKKMDLMPILIIEGKKQKQRNQQEAKAKNKKSKLVI